MSASRGTALYEVLRNVRPLVLSSVRVVETALRPHGLTLGMRAVLEVLHDRGPATVPSVARDLDLTRQAVQRHVNDLIGLGHVEQQPNPAHRRSVLLGLTPRGAEAIRRVSEEELRHLAGMAPECTPEEITAAVKVLSALNRDVRRRATSTAHERDPRDY